jgi:hypothetical protein
VTTTLTPGTWTEHESGLDPDSGDVGGDIQATDAASRRWIKPLDDGTYALVTVYAYGTREFSEARDAYLYDVQEQIEWMRCADWEEPGGTEIDCDYTYTWPFSIAPSDLDVAFNWAKNHVTSYDPDRDFDWDGLAPISH